MLLAVTNNPLVLEKVEHTLEVKGDPVEVLLEVRKKLQKGFKLVSMPLPPNQRLFMNPYRTVVIGDSRKEKDMNGLVLVEKALDKLRPQVFADPGFYRDFDLLDYELTQTALDTASFLGEDL
ncbi:MAG TPA: GrdX family protein [Synergistales bacterium]|nr:GrdX family protein [Synergistales bacterium]